MTDDAELKQIVVLARNDQLEAMRVAAGLTIVGHGVMLLFMSRALTAAEADSEQAELVELTEIETRTTVQAMGEYFELLTAAELGAMLLEADVVMSL